ncbi:MAG: carboxypeptidase-like regulatory domain-containing protein [Planctomycetota bacterium]
MTSAPILSLLSLLAVAPMQEAQTAKPTFRIRGTVVDVCYVPVAGARVGFIAGKDSLAEAECDERGHFRLEVGATGSGRIVVRHDGFARVAVPLELTEGRTLVSCGELRLPPARDLIGKVTGPDDEPLAGARLELLHGDRGLFSLDRYETTSDAEGGFRFADAPLGDVLLFAWASGTELAEEELCHSGDGPVEVDLGKAPKTVLELRLEGAAPPQGRIRYHLVREFRGRNPLPRALAIGTFEGSVHRIEGLPHEDAASPSRRTGPCSS